MSLFPESAYADGSSVANPQLEKWRDAVPAWEYEAAFIYRKFGHRLGWEPGIVDDLDLAIVAGYMNDWQAADDEQEKQKREQGRKGFSGPGAEAMRQINAQSAVQQQERDPRIPAHLTGTQARVYALQHNLPVPKAPVYNENVIPKF